MDDLQARHRRELKDLQGRITQKKKQATKKTRKGVNDECDALERELREKQSAEVAAVNGSDTPGTQDPGSTEVDDLAKDVAASSLESPSQSSLPSVASVPPSTQDGAQVDTEANQNGFHKKPNRARQRLARRAAEQEALFNQASQEASDMPNLKVIEREKMVAEFKKRGLEEKEIRADGHCMYSAFADQMDLLGLPLKPGATATKTSRFRTFSNGFKKDGADGVENKLEQYKTVRKAAADYIQGHPDEFEPFLEEPLPEYIYKVRETGEWGGQLELIALAKTYNVRISVLQGDGRVEDIAPEQQQPETLQNMWLAYYRHGFGLGEHYNSLRTKAG